MVVRVVTGGVVGGRVSCLVDNTCVVGGDVCRVVIGVVADGWVSCLVVETI